MISVKSYGNLLMLKQIPEDPSQQDPTQTDYGYIEYFQKSMENVSDSEVKEEVIGISHSAGSQPRYSWCAKTGATNVPVNAAAANKPFISTGMP